MNKKQKEFIISIILSILLTMFIGWITVSSFTLEANKLNINETTLNSLNEIKDDITPDVIESKIDAFTSFYSNNVIEICLVIGLIWIAFLIGVGIYYDVDKRLGDDKDENN